MLSAVIWIVVVGDMLSVAAIAVINFDIDAIGKILLLFFSI